ncbi:hypothetical protein, partial [Rhodoblastus sp.]|uniref:hypothetical protein n=1 Tax=Rhodoblastus sp. TaxID=1962975 RepID=UPI002607C656
MGRGLREDRREGVWRAWFAGLVALVFLLQAVGSFAAPPCHMAMGRAVAKVDHGATPPHRRPNRADGHAHGAPDSCPMCQALGCALAGARPPVVVARGAARVILLVSLAAR